VAYLFANMLIKFVYAILFSDNKLWLFLKQCDLQLGFGGPKQQIYPSFEQQLRMASAGAPPYGGMGRHDSIPVPEPTLMLGYAPQLGNCPPPFQLGWGPSYSKMVDMLQSVCVWCNSPFQHFGTVAEQQADSLGYICPSCKGKFSGHLGINGPSIWDQFLVTWTGAGPPSVSSLINESICTCSMYPL